ncbi:hypothetical protein RB2501_09350 [Robiginitalea biformata HTCC2501]|uniref:Uncharacterized protein n=1 Tax=Robiginitalea biformata (strain ATCC BAA-864 / DSM 15991 / KCTC 12146 / HTCC2501) TaxID=313596 RepID=A4CJJ0_ROBBH|nr:hypothetical protein RB2501_09350 [Robiginitalea biformata HTCC2501]
MVRPAADMWIFGPMIHMYNHLIHLWDHPGPFPHSFGMAVNKGRERTPQPMAFQPAATRQSTGQTTQVMVF